MANKKPLKISAASQALASGSLTHTLTIGAGDESHERFASLEDVFIHASGNISQTVTVSLKSVLDTTNRVYELNTTSLSSADDYHYQPTRPIPLILGDIITVTCSNSGTPSITVYSEIRYREDM